MCVYDTWWQRVIVFERIIKLVSYRRGGAIGSALDSKSSGCGFKSRPLQLFLPKSKSPQIRIGQGGEHVYSNSRM